MSEPGVDRAATTSGRRAPHGGNEAAADEAGSAAPGRQQPADGPGAPHERDEVWIGQIDGFGGVAAAKERGKKTDEEEIAGRNVHRFFFFLRGSGYRLRLDRYTMGSIPHRVILAVGPILGTPLSRYTTGALKEESCMDRPTNKPW